MTNDMFSINRVFNSGKIGLEAGLFDGLHDLYCIYAIAEYLTVKLGSETATLSRYRVAN